MAAKINELKGDAPAAFDTLGEVAAWIANSDDASAAMLQAISERAKTSDVNAALEGKADAGAENTAQWGLVAGKPSVFPSDIPNVSGLDTALAGKAPTPTGTASAGTFYSSNGTWATPTNTTYAAMTQATADTGTSTTANTVSGKVLRDTIGKAAVVNATYGATATLWFGNQAAYDALASATKNAAGFIAVITA